MLHQHIEALVVERCHQLGIDRTPLGILHAQRPLFLLTWLQPVAEGCPLQTELLIRQRALDLGLMGMALAVLHPGEGEQQAIAVCFLIGQFEAHELVAPVIGTPLDDLLAREYTVEDMDILVGRTYLKIDGLAVVGELLGRKIEPVVGLGHGTLIMEREKHEAMGSGITLADSFQRVGTAWQSLSGDGQGRICRSRLPGAVVNAVAHLGIEILAGSIEQMEGGGRLIIEQHLICHLDLQCLLTVAQRQGELSAMGLTGSICHISHHDEVVEHRIAGLGHRQWHLYGKRTVICRFGSTIINLHPIRAIAYPRGVPIAAIGPPPVCCTTDDLVADLRPLDRYSRETHGRALHRKFIACGIGLLHLREVDMERRALVFLYPNRMTLTIGLDGIVSGKSGGWQREVYRRHTVFIGSSVHVMYHLIVGITNDEMDCILFADSLLHPVTHLIFQSRDVNRLPRTINGTIGIDIRQLLIIVVRREVVAATLVERRTSLIAVGIGKHLPTGARITVLEEILTLTIRHGTSLLGIAIGDILTDAKMSAGYGLTCRGIDNDITDSLL